MEIEKIKEFIVDDTLRIELHDLMANDLETLLESFDSEKFSGETKFSYEEFENRIKRCEELVKELCQISALLGYWGSKKQINNYVFPIMTLSNKYKGSKESKGWKAVKWHSIRLLFYYGGITALAAGNYRKLYQLFDLRITDSSRTVQKISICESLTAVNSRMDSLYNKLMENKDHTTPLSEYLFHQIKPIMNEVIYLGPSFESLFDRFEILYALDYINRTNDEIPEKAWAPTGRFVLKQYGDNPFQEIIKEAELKEEDWALLRSGFFRGSYSRFQQICTSFQERLQRFRF
ncbi:hypothetical protein NC796_13935 [Aliifodinibius sp. S!AR15-10]|uniref:hypothetical protein n=1 Tax=Aliifodinibius sp. S!AR15-10 TaxID=2950437 RepID=UPI0028647262|nr:hypothetical protein [Aliifodinibius sp. S!AR15-10]MDR8392249.1 hypothetical protein [Aliifodinibius sp. S!AR15-10]